MKTSILKVGIVLIFASIAAFVIFNELSKEEEVFVLPEGFQIFEQDRKFDTLLIVENILYAGGFEGVYRFNLATGEALGQLTAPSPLTVVKALFHEQDNVLWVGYQDGIAVFQDGKFLKYLTKDDGIPEGRVNAILRDRNGRIVIGTFHGVYFLQNEKWTGVTEQEGLINDMVNVMFEDSRGFLWTGSNVNGVGGLTCMGDGKTWRIGIPQGLCHVAVTSVTEDMNHDIWVGTGVLYSGGANRLSFVDGDWQVAELLNDENGLPGEKIRYVHLDMDQNLWFCTEFDGAAVYKDRKMLTLLEQKDGLSDNEIKCIVQDAHKNYYLATSKGITVISYEAFTKICEKE